MLMTEAVCSKKADISATAAFKGLQLELTPFGMSLIMGLSTDGASTAIAEAKLIARKLDEHTVGLPEAERAQVVVHSSKVEGLTYAYGGSFRELRLRLCLMHNLERILCALLMVIFQQQGLAHQACVAQIIYTSRFWTLHVFVDI